MVVPLLLLLLLLLLPLLEVHLKDLRLAVLVHETPSGHPEPSALQVPALRLSGQSSFCMLVQVHSMQVCEVEPQTQPSAQ